MLSCRCDDITAARWWYYPPADFTTMPGLKRRKRCISCNTLINKGAEYCVEFKRYRYPASEIEEKIVGDEIPIPSYWMCPSCGEIFLNLSAAGFCLDIVDMSMIEYMEQYRKEYGQGKNDKG